MTQMHQGWTDATYRCGRCGRVGAATTEADYTHMVSVHQAAHDVWERLTPAQRKAVAALALEVNGDHFPARAPRPNTTQETF